MTIDIHSVIDHGETQHVASTARLGKAVLDTFSCVCSRTHDSVVVVPGLGPGDGSGIEVIEIGDKLHDDEARRTDRRAWAAFAATAAVRSFLGDTEAPVYPPLVALQQGRIKTEDLDVIEFLRREYPCRSDRIYDQVPCDANAHEGRLQRLRRAGLIAYRVGRWSLTDAVPESLHF
jgi:hypothetical protein